MQPCHVDATCPPSHQPPSKPPSNTIPLQPLSLLLYRRMRAGSNSNSGQESSQDLDRELEAAKARLRQIQAERLALQALKEKGTRNNSVDMAALPPVPPVGPGLGISPPKRPGMPAGAAAGAGSGAAPVQQRQTVGSLGGPTYRNSRDGSPDMPAGPSGGCPSPGLLSVGRGSCFMP